MEADYDENEKKHAIESSKNLIQHCLGRLYQAMPEMVINDGSHHIKH